MDEAASKWPRASTYRVTVYLKENKQKTSAIGSFPSKDCFGTDEVLTGRFLKGQNQLLFS